MDRNRIKLNNMKKILILLLISVSAKAQNLSFVMRTGGNPPLTDTLFAFNPSTSVWHQITKDPFDWDRVMYVVEKSHAEYPRVVQAKEFLLPQLLNQLKDTTKPK